MDASARAPNGLLHERTNLAKSATSACALAQERSSTMSTSLLLAQTNFDAGRSGDALRATRRVRFAFRESWP